MAAMFKQAFDDKRELRPAFVRERGFSARVFPDYIDRDGFLSFAKEEMVDGKSQIVIHHAEFGAEEKTLFQNDAASGWESVFDLSHEDMIVEFVGRNLFLWLPSGEHMYVVFGDRKYVESLGEPSELLRVFQNYVENSGLTEQGKEFLHDCSQKYNI